MEAPSIKSVNQIQIVRKELKNKGFLDDDKPIILLGDYWNELVELVAMDDPDCKRHLLFADEPKDVVGLLKK